MGGKGGSKGGKDSGKGTALPIIFDMETGDPDDVLTLLLLAAHSDVHLKAVTISRTGSRDQVALVRWVLLKIGLGHLRVGAQDWPRNFDDPPLKDRFYQGQNFGRLETGKDDCELASQVLLDCCDEHTTLLTGGPVGNLAAALSTEGFRLGRWVAQGGFAGEGVVPRKLQMDKFRDKTYNRTFNFGENPRAASTALKSKKIGHRICVSKNVCHRTWYDDSKSGWHGCVEEAVRTTRDQGGPPVRLKALELIHKVMSNYLKHKPGKMLHDPLAAAVALDRSVCSLKEVEFGSHGDTWGCWLQPGSGTWVSIDYDESKFRTALLGNSFAPQKQVCADWPRSAQRADNAGVMVVGRTSSHGGVPAIILGGRWYSGKQVYAYTDFGGGVNRGETPHQGAMRELAEELLGAAESSSEADALACRLCEETASVLVGGAPFVNNGYVIFVVSADTVLRALPSPRLQVTDAASHISAIDQLFAAAKMNKELTSVALVSIEELVLCAENGHGQITPLAVRQLDGRKRECKDIVMRGVMCGSVRATKGSLLTFCSTPRVETTSAVSIPASQLDFFEKKVLAAAKRVRAIRDLEGQDREALQPNQRAKLESKTEVAEAFLAAMGLMPSHSDVAAKVEDVVSYLLPICRAPDDQIGEVIALEASAAESTQEMSQASVAQLPSSRAEDLSTAVVRKEARRRPRGGRNGFERKFDADHQ